LARNLSPIGLDTKVDLTYHHTQQSDTDRGIFAYPEWWRDWPDETRQPLLPASRQQEGANSCGVTREIRGMQAECASFASSSWRGFFVARIRWKAQGRVRTPINSMKGD